MYCFHCGAELLVRGSVRDAARFASREAVDGSEAPLLSGVGFRGALGFADVDIRGGKRAPRHPRGHAERAPTKWQTDSARS